MNYKGVYMSMDVTPLTEYHLFKYCRDNLNGLELPDKFHVTLIHSTEPFEGDVKLSDTKKLPCKHKGFNKFGDNNNNVVLELDSQELMGRNKELVSSHGFKSDYDSYNPHITLSTNGDNIDISDLPSIDFEINLTNESIEELIEDLEELKENKEEKPSNDISDIVNIMNTPQDEHRIKLAAFETRQGKEDYEAEHLGIVG